jgi:hypothetical protein
MCFFLILHSRNPQWWMLKGTIRGMIESHMSSCLGFEQHEAWHVDVCLNISKEIKGAVFFAFRFHYILLTWMIQKPGANTVYPWIRKQDPSNWMVEFPSLAQVENFGFLGSFCRSHPAYYPTPIMFLFKIWSIIVWGKSQSQFALVCTSQGLFGSRGLILVIF